MVELSCQASLVAQRVKRLPAMQETQVRSLGQEDILEKEMATNSSTLAWKIPWMEKPGRLQSMGCNESDTTERLYFFTSVSCQGAWLGLEKDHDRKVRITGHSNENWETRSLGVNHHLMLSVKELFGLSESSWNKELLSSRQEFPGIVMLMKRLE